MVFEKISGESKYFIYIFITQIFRKPFYGGLRELAKLAIRMSQVLAIVDGVMVSIFAFLSTRP